MDKVIIDGVDVSGCKHYKIGTCLADYLFTDMNFSEAKCKLCPDCYYKQLKRLEQENEQIKKSYAKLHIDFAKCNEENERLKEENEKLNKMTGIFSARLCEKYRQALQEIRDIARKTGCMRFVEIVDKVIGAEE